MYLLHSVEREATKIRDQGNQLRELLKIEMLQKQRLKNQYNDVLDTIKKADETISLQNDIVSDKYTQMNNLQKALDNTKATKPVVNVPVAPIQIPPAPVAKPVVNVPVAQPIAQPPSLVNPPVNVQAPVSIPVQAPGQKLTIDDKRNAVKQVSPSDIP